MAKRLAEKVIFKTKLFTLKDIHIEFDNGKKDTYQILEKKDTVVVIPVTSDNKVILIKEYMAAINEYQYDFPGGRVEKGHNIEETANKELQEEIGYKAGKLEKLAIVTMSPGYLTQRTHIFLAKKLLTK